MLLRNNMLLLCRLLSPHASQYTNTQLNYNKNCCRPLPYRLFFKRAPQIKIHRQFSHLWLGPLSYLSGSAPDSFDSAKPKGSSSHTPLPPCQQSAAHTPDMSQPAC